MILSIQGNRNKFFGLHGPFLGVPVGYAALKSSSGKHRTCSSFRKAHYALGDPPGLFSCGLCGLWVFLQPLARSGKSILVQDVGEMTQKEVGSS